MTRKAEDVLMELHTRRQDAMARPNDPAYTPALDLAHALMNATPELIALIESVRHLDQCWRGEIGWQETTLQRAWADVRDALAALDAKIGGGL